MGTLITGPMPGGLPFGCRGAGTALTGRDKDSETNLSTEKTATTPPTRFSPPDGHKRGAAGVGSPTRQRANPPHGLSAPTRRWSRLPVLPDHRFPRSERLVRSRDFDVLIRTGRFFRHPLFTLVLAQTGVHRRRLGVSVGKRVGRAVIRNRVKRRLRALYVQHRHLLPECCDCLLIVQPKLATATPALLAHAIERTFARAGQRHTSRHRRRPEGRTR